jgi:hypothetical protein
VRTLDRDDLPDEDDVIAGGEARMVMAFEPRDAALDQWGVRPAEAKRHVLEAILVRA